MRKLIFGMNLTLDGYIAAPGDDIGWSDPSDELFRWWLDQELGIGLMLYGRKLWEAMSSYWPTGDRQPDATPAQIEFARNWRDPPKVVFSSTIDEVGWNTRLVTGDPVAEITRLKAGDGGSMRIGGATLAGAAMRAGLIDEYAIVTHPVLVGGGTARTWRPCGPRRTRSRTRSRGWRARWTRRSSCSRTSRSCR
ncbi:dihydrofolate reductase family protein [Amycolatopsis sp. NPDC058278]|uniref:dihydrofolate reductase family protein n=1 Tax=Amycolatopsis sp. NPDC058278 TaxID=3346417 RepID=UPI0036DE526D